MFSAETGFYENMKYLALQLLSIVADTALQNSSQEDVCTVCVLFTQCSRDLWHESLEESKHKRGGGKAKEEERKWKGTKALRPTQQSWAVKSTAASRRTPTSYITALHLHTEQRAEIIASHKLSMRPPNRSIARLYLPLLTLALLIELFRDVMISHPIKMRQWETLTFLNPTDG